MTTKFLIEMSYSKSDKRPFPTHFAKNFMNTLYNDE